MLFFAFLSLLAMGDLPVGARTLTADGIAYVRRGSAGRIVAIPSSLT